MRHPSQHIVFAFLIGLFFFTSCANRGIGPQGGPKDSIPPSVVKQTPLNGTVNYQSNRMEIVFDEYIQLDNVVENVLISPPQQIPPEVKAVGKKLSFVFQEPLKDSTTYTVDFGSAICDFTEKNPLKGYSVSFSTGDQIDSLEIAGTLYNAENLNPAYGVMIGIHSDLQDSAFEKLPFERIARTDSAGHFVIHNIRSGNYRVYALRDVSRDYRYQPGEDLAFSDSVFTPIAEVRQICDTIWKTIDTLLPVEPDTTHGATFDTVQTLPFDTIQIITADTHWEGDSITNLRHVSQRVVDSVRVVNRTQFTPDNVVLWYFKEQKTRHYLQRSKREAANKFGLYFSAPQDTVPVIRSLRLSAVDTLRSDTANFVDWIDYVRWQVSPKRDTIIGWLSDSIAIRQDSIAMEVEYMKTDSLYQLYRAVDTVMVVWRAPVLSPKAQETRDKKERTRKLRITGNANAKFEIYDTLRVMTDVPVDSIHMEKIRLYQKVDTAYHPLDFQFIPKDSSKMIFMVICPFEPEKQYELRIDSAAMCDIYGKVCDASKLQLQLKSKEDYSSVKILMKDYDSRAVIQLLTDKDEVLCSLPAVESGTVFENITPKDYYMRLFIDLNGDGRWTTGDWATHRQPEPVYYFPGKLTLRANWDFEETFDHLGTPQLESKPQPIRTTHVEKKK